MKLNALKNGLYIHLMSVVGMLVLGGAGAWGQSALPAEPANFLSVTGTLANGDNDIYQVVFFEVPDTVSGPLYFSVYDPGVDGTVPSDVDPDQGNTGTWEFRLIGGTGTLSGSTARNVIFANQVAATQGTTLGNVLSGTGNLADTDQNWVYFEPVYPNQGEKIGNKYYFKVFATHSDGSKNAYRLNVSYAPGPNLFSIGTMTHGGSPTGVSSIRAFNYAWTLAFRSRAATETWDLYPFVPDSAIANITRYFYDFDLGEAGELFNKDGTSVATGLTGDGTATATESSYPVTGQTNGTWRLRFVENATDGLPVNTATVFFAGSDPVENYRIYAASYTPPEPHHAVLSPVTASALENVPVTMTLQIVDVDGNPVPYARTVLVTASNGAVLSDGDGLVTTSGDGIAVFTVNIADVASGTASTTISVFSDGTGGTSRLPLIGALGTNGSATITFNDAADSAPTLDHTAYGFTQGSAGSLPMLTLTETVDAAASNISSANGIRILIPDTLNAFWDQTVTNPVFGGTASGRVNVATPVTYESSRVLRINLDTDFADGDALTIGSLLFTTTNGPSSDRLVLSYSGSSGPYIVTASNAITVNAATSYTWDGGGALDNWADPLNWSPDAVPDGAVNATIGSGFTVLVDGAGYDVLNLTILPGATLQLTSDTLAVNGTLNLDGTLDIAGTVGLTGSAPFDTNSGTVTYTGTGGAGLAQGNAYYNLSIDNTSGAYTLNANLDVYGTMTIGGATSSLDAATRTITLYGDWVQGAGTFTASTSTLALAGSATSSLSGSSTFYNLQSTVAGKRILLADGQVFTVQGNLTLKGSSSAKLELWSTTSGNQFTLTKDPAGTQDLQYLSVRDSAVGATSTDLTASFSTSVSNNDIVTPGWVFPVGGAFVWQGDDVTDPTFWEVAANWDQGTVPGATDAVFIPTTTSDPRLDQARTIGALTVYGGGWLDLNAFVLTVSGDVQNDGTINGIASSGIVAANVNSTGTIANTGAFSISASGNASISGTYSTPTNGTLIMSGAGKTLNATPQLGNVTVNSAGSITAGGTLSLAGDLALTAGTLAMGSNGLTAGGNISRGTGAITSTGTIAVTGAGIQTADLGGSTLATIAPSKTGGSLEFTTGFTATTFAVGANKAFDLSFNTAAAQTTTIAGSVLFDNTGALVLGNDAADILLFDTGLTAAAPASVTLNGTLRTSADAVVIGDAGTP